MTTSSSYENGSAERIFSCLSARSRVGWTFRSARSLRHPALAQLEHLGRARPPIVFHVAVRVRGAAEHGRATAAVQLLAAAQSAGEGVEQLQCTALEGRAVLTVERRVRPQPA